MMKESNTHTHTPIKAAKTLENFSGSRVGRKTVNVLEETVNQTLYDT